LFLIKISLVSYIARLQGSKLPRGPPRPRPNCRLCQRIQLPYDDSHKHAMRHFLVDFFFGPCLDDSALDPRQDGPPRGRPQRLYQSQQHLNGGSIDKGSKNSTSPESDDRSRITAKGKGIDKSGKISNTRSSIGDVRSSTGDTRTLPRGRATSGGQRTKPSPYLGDVRSSTRDAKTLTRGRATNGGQGTSSSPHHLNGYDGYRRSRSDDASVMTASLVETYRGYSTENREEYLDEQSVIRRSLKDVRRPKKTNGGEGWPLQQQIAEINIHEQRQLSSDTRQASEQTSLESWIVKTGKLQSRTLDPDDDNVTTISKASKNPYSVLGISHSAPPLEIHRTYKHKMRETDRLGGSDKAFVDVENAYRRIKADIALKERRRMSQQAKGVSITEESRSKSHSRSNHSDDDSDSAKTRIDKRLRDHRELVGNLFAIDNSWTRSTNGPSSGSVSGRGQVTTLKQAVNSQTKALSEMNLVAIEAGAVNVNEQNQSIQNNCFYLSLAASYLSGTGAFDEDPTLPYHLKSLNKSENATDSMETVALENRPKQITMNLALQLKRAIESAVLLVHPEWAESGMVGEEVQAFSDFLVYALDSNSVLGHWAIAVFDEASGFVDVYRGRHYGKIYPPTKHTIKPRRARNSDPGTEKVRWKYKECNEAAKRGNTLTLRYVDNHYQPVLPELTKKESEGRREADYRGGLSERPTLEDIVATLDKWEVLHVVTDGRA
jgi:hypothetical protein